MLTDFLEHPRDALRVFRRRRTWTTGEIDPRIRLTLITRCRKYEHINADHPALFLRAILVDLESAALRRPWHAPERAVV
jgi:hypothetical protein